MKTKSFLIITVLTGFLSSQVFAQVDTTKKSDTSSKQKKDTAWKKDTNQVNLNSNVQDDRRARINTGDQNKNAVVITNQFLLRESKNLWRRTRAQAYSGSC
ncbi:MAG TPA: hypothetical protein VJU78_07975 [Chitinophagaceae bacterium]|nr:hypothetical protein [Chitinophagaceae bacterium]